MAQVLILIALGGGLSKMILSGSSFDFSKENYLYSAGFIIFFGVGINFIITIIRLKLELKKLKDTK